MCTEKKKKKVQNHFHICLFDRGESKIMVITVSHNFHNVSKLPFYKMLLLYSTTPPPQQKAE
jgi:hypothetical protein